MRNVKYLFLSIALIIGLGFLSCSSPITGPVQSKALANQETSRAVASSGTAFGRLTGVNWFGFETSNYAPHGLWARDYKSMLQQIHDLGFNCIRLPWCNDMIGKSPNGIQINASGVDAYTKITGMNTDLAGLTSIQVMDKIIGYANTLGIKIILDNHSKQADGYMNETLWYTATTSEDKWISDWVMMASRYASYPNVVGADLKNEPHGNMGQGMKPPATWGYDQSGYTNTDWRKAAEKCGLAVLKANPNLLIIIEGTEEYKGATYWWGGNLQGVNDYPITSIPANRLVYSAHEYGPEVYNQSWFTDPSFPSNMPAIWDKNFWYIYKNGIAPLFFGEFGIKEVSAADPSSPGYKWITSFMQYVGSKSSWTFWCMNPNSGDTGGILQDDWVSVNTGKYNIIKPYLEPLGSTPSPTPSVTPTPSPTPSVTPTPSPTPSVTPTPSPTPSVTPTPSPTPSVTPSPSPVPVAVSVTFTPMTGSGNTISLNLTVKNVGTSDIDLSQLIIKYYFTKDSSVSLVFFKDHVGGTISGTYKTITTNLSGTFTAVSPAKTTADTLATLTFASGTGILKSGESVDIQARIAKSDWSNFTFTNDYSNAASGVIPVYYGTSLVLGVEP